jgi:tetratricopeptide (TPR) repeat protein
MDLTTLAGAFLLALGLLGANAVMHANSVIVEVVAPPKLDKLTIDQPTLELQFADHLYAIANTPSVVVPPEIRASHDQGIGMALAREAKLEDVAYALQSELGYKPAKLRLALFVEDGALRGLVSGSSGRVGSFHAVLIPEKDETVLAFVNRCALWGASQLAPYITALYLLQQHAADRNFTDVVALIEQTKAKLPSAPVSFDRSTLDNLLGIVALFKNDPKAAQASFDQAVAEYPTNAVAAMNAAFADVQLDDYKKAAERMQRLVNDAPPSNKTLLATAYLTWAAAEMGLHDLGRANELLATATTLDPDNSSALDLWAEAKEEMGDKAAAAALRQKTLQSSETFENYGEVATLYFHLAWRDNQPITRSQFTNPTVVTFH